MRLSPLRNAFGGQVMGSTARARRSTSGTIAREQHQVRVGLVDPQRKGDPAVGIRELDPGEAVLVSLEISEPVVELRVADGSRLAKVVVGTGDGCRARRNAPAVRLEHRSRRRPQNRGIDGLGADAEVRVRSAPVRTAIGPDVRRGRPHREALVGERVLDAQVQRERVPGLGMEPVRHHRSVGLAARRRSRPTSGRGRGSRLRARAR